MKKLFVILGAFLGIIIAFLLRPSITDGAAYADKPSVFMMLQCGIITCNHPSITSASRFTLLYIVAGTILGGAIGWLIGSLTKGKNR